VVETVRAARSGVTNVTVHAETGAVIAMFRASTRTVGRRIMQKDVMTAWQGGA
jgi:hypothetical protein